MLKNTLSLFLFILACNASAQYRQLSDIQSIEGAPSALESLADGTSLLVTELGQALVLDANGEEIARHDLSEDNQNIAWIRPRKELFLVTLQGVMQCAYALIDKQGQLLKMEWVDVPDIFDCHYTGPAVWLDDDTFMLVLSEYDWSVRPNVMRLWLRKMNTNGEILSDYNTGLNELGRITGQPKLVKTAAGQYLLSWGDLDTYHNGTSRTVVLKEDDNAFQGLDWKLYVNNACYQELRYGRWQVNHLPGSGEYRLYINEISGSPVHTAMVDVGASMEGEMLMKKDDVLIATNAQDEELGRVVVEHNDEAGLRVWCNPDRDSMQIEKVSTGTEEPYAARLFWEYSTLPNSEDLLEIRVHTPDGKLFHRSGPKNGFITTGDWVRDGMLFYLILHDKSTGSSSVIDLVRAG